MTDETVKPVVKLEGVATRPGQLSGVPREDQAYGPPLHHQWGRGLAIFFLLFFFLTCMSLPLMPLRILGEAHEGNPQWYHHIFMGLYVLVTIVWLPIAMYKAFRMIASDHPDWWR